MPRLLCLAALVLAACSSGEAEPLPLDGVRSLSPGGALVHFRFEPGDGSALLDTDCPAGRACRAGVCATP